MGAKKGRKYGKGAPFKGAPQTFREAVATNCPTGSATASEANHVAWPDITAKVALCVANWYSVAREMTDFRYFPKF